MKHHERFESLLGAVVLGEATSAESAEFAAHAATCAACRADAHGAPAFVAAVAEARDAERWRPSLGHVVVARIRDVREKRSRATLGVLGWSIALSLVLNVAFVSGFSTRVATVFRATGEPVSRVAALPVALDAPVARIAGSERSLKRGAPVARAPQRRARRTDARGHAAFVRARVAAQPHVAEALSAPGPIPDILAGLDIDGAGGRAARRVAVVSSPPCVAGPRTAVARDGTARDGSVSGEQISEARSYDGVASNGASYDGVNSNGGFGERDVDGEAAASGTATRPLGACAPTAQPAAYSGSEGDSLSGSSSRN